MSTTSETTTSKSRSINARVTEDFYEVFAAKAAEVPGRTPTEFARYLCERAVYEEPAALKLLEELCALRYIVLNGLPEVAAERAAAMTVIRKIQGEADERKAARAQTILKGTR